MNRHVLAADLGGTNLRMAVVADDGSILHRIKRPTPHSGGADGVVSAIVDSARESINAAGTVTIKSLVIAVPATINSVEGVLRNAPNLPFLNGFNLSAPVSAALGISVTTDNDATLAAAGESWLGACVGYQNAVCVTLGTGVGGGLILNGEPYRGSDGTAGEIGHICVEPDGVGCGCGSIGCLEQYASATAIVRMARDSFAEYPDSALAGLETFTSYDIFEAGMKSDALALEVFRNAGRYLGIALAGLVNVLNPEIIVVGGGMAAAFELFAHHLRAEIDKRAFREPAQRVKLVPAKLGDDAGILGAARLALSSQSQASTSIV